MGEINNPVRAEIVLTRWDGTFLFKIALAM